MQIRFVTRVGQQQLHGQQLLLPAATTSWTRTAGSTTATGDPPKNEDKLLYQPGTRFGGPIVIPGLWDGRNKAFFFVNYEESRSPGQNIDEPDDPAPARGAGHLPLQRRRPACAKSTCSHLAAAERISLATDRSDHSRTVSATSATPSTAGRLVDLDRIRWSRSYRYQYDTDNVTRYPTGRLDFNLTDKHRLSGSMNYTDLHSTPGHDQRPRAGRSPASRDTGSQHSDRYVAAGEPALDADGRTWSTSSRSAAAAARRCSRPEISVGAVQRHADCQP